jgi:hypothetical protein
MVRNLKYQVAFFSYSSWDIIVGSGEIKSTKIHFFPFPESLARTVTFPLRDARSNERRRQVRNLPVHALIRSSETGDNEKLN